MYSTSKTQLIQNQSDLNAFIESIQHLNSIAIDTEFVREKTYYPQPGLIQIAADDQIACIDPVLTEDLSSLYNLLSNPSITKIIHAAGQDLELLYVMSGEAVTPIFDTQVAADLLNEGNQIGYAGLVEKKTGVVLPKAHTRTNWLARPLSSEQIRYAAEDVLYLDEIYRSQHTALQLAGRLEWLEEDCATLVAKQQQEQSADQLLLRIKGHYELSGAHRAIARELALWRENAAKKRDLPRRWILADEVMIRLAQSKPDSLSELTTFDGLTPSQLKKFSDEIITSIQTGASINESDWPPPAKASRPTAAADAQLKKLRSALGKIAVRENLSPTLFASRKSLEGLIEGNSDIPLMRGWRYQQAGKEIEALL